jgi:acetyl-CoA acetyltransferase
MSSVSGRYAIVGVGTSRFGKLQGVSTMGFTLEASKRAIEDPGIRRDAIDGVLVMMPAIMGEQHGWAARVAGYLGIEPTFSATMDMGGATACGSVQTAIAAIDAGYCTAVLCSFATQNWPQGVAMQLFGSEFQVPYGDVGALTLMGHIKRRQMHEHGYAEEQYGQIAVTWRTHALKNPDAQMKKPLSMAQYHEAPQIVSPFGLYDCSLRSDGAGAVIVTSRERARDLKQPPVLIKGFGSFNNLRGWFNDDNMVVTAAKKSGEIAYSMAGLGPDDVDTAQIYDCFTYMVLTQLEDYGFCKKGEGGDFVASGALRMGGRLPTNTSGGQLSEAHVEGMLQVVEGVRQMRHTYPADRQVKDAEIALVSGHGGNQVCHSTLILGRA